MSKLPDYVTPEYLSTLNLRQGLGSGKPGDRCAIQEVRAWLDLDTGSDATPDCVSRVCARFVIKIQDARAEWRESVRELLPRLIGSRGSLALERRRAFRCADWAVREVAPMALDAKGLGESAAKLRSCRPVIDLETAMEGCAYAAATAAADAADAADAAYAAYAADDAATAAAYAAYAAAAYAAVTAAANKLDPIALLKEMLDMQEEGP